MYITKTQVRVPVAAILFRPLPKIFFFQGKCIQKNNKSYQMRLLIRHFQGKGFFQYIFQLSPGFYGSQFGFAIAEKYCFSHKSLKMRQKLVNEATNFILPGPRNLLRHMSNFLEILWQPSIFRCYGGNLVSGFAKKSFFMCLIVAFRRFEWQLLTLLVASQ